MRHAKGEGRDRACALCFKVADTPRKRWRELWPEIAAWEGNRDCSNTHPKESIALKTPPYVAMYPTLAKAAKACGYALAAHGSMARDMDLIAVPWVDGAVSAEALVEELRSACGGWIHAPETKRDPAHMPHGRLGWTIHLGGALDSAEPMAYIDLSVMPLGKPE